MARLMFSSAPRICYNSTREKVYELHALCTCTDCQARSTTKREPPNWVTATTKEIEKIDAIKKFLENWICSNGKKLADRTYFKF